MTDAKTVAGEVGAAINEFQKIEPWLATIIPMVFPPAAPVMPVVNAFEPVIMTFVARALSDIASSNGGDLPSAMIELFQHLTKGQPNSPILSTFSGIAIGGSPKPDMPPTPSAS